MDLSIKPELKQEKLFLLCNSNKKLPVDLQTSHAKISFTEKI